MKHERNDTIILVLIIILAMGLYTHNLGSKSLWFDEVLSLKYAQLGVEGIITYPDTPHPPLYYLLLHFFLYLGSSEFILRLPSVIFGVLSIPLAYKLASTFFGSREGLLTAFLLSTSPMLVYYCQDARMYTLFMFLSLLSLTLFYNAIRKDDFKLWAGFVISTALCLYTHYFTFLVILVEVVFFIIVVGKYKNSTRGFMLSLLCIGILFLPQLSGLYAGALEKTGTKPLWGNEPDIFFVTHVLNTLSGGRVILILFIPLFLWGIFKSIKAKREETTLSLAWIFIPILAAFFMAFKMPVVDRYLIFILPLYLIIVSRGICNIGNRQLMVCLIIAILLFNGYYLHKQYNAQMGDWKSAAKYLRVNAIAGDVILLIPGEDLCLEYYDIDPKRIIILADINSFPVETRDIRSRYDNVWVIYSIHTSIRDPNLEIVGWLTQTCNKTVEFDEISIYLCKKDVNTGGGIYTHIPGSKSI